MQIFVKTTTQGTITLDVDQFDTVDNVKRMIYGMRRFKFGQFILEFAGQRLDGEHSIRDYNIEEGSVLHFRLNSGLEMLFLD